MLGENVLPIDSSIQTWRSGMGGQVEENLGQALLLPTDIESYSGYQDEDLILKMKWHNIVVSTPSFFQPSFFFFFFFFFFKY